MRGSRRTAGMGFVVALAAAAATGCTITDATESTEATPSAASSSAFCDEIEPTLADAAEALLVPAAVVLVRSPEVGECFLSFGTRDIDEEQPVGIDDQFRIGSNTKTMTGTVILQLVEENKLRLDDPVSMYRDDVPNGENITIEQMLNMSSGLADYSADPQIIQSMDETPERVWTADEVLALSYAQPPGFPPGEGYLYSNANTVLLGLIIEDLTGEPLEETFQARIFGPLGLERTLLPAATLSTMPEEHARGYLFGTVTNWFDTDGVLSPEDVAAAKAGALHPDDVTDMNPSWGWAAGAGISTTDDLARYVKALVTGELLGDEMHEHRLASVQPTDPGNPASPAYGEAIVRYGELYGHTGELPGYNTFMGHDPERDITVIAWGNMMSGPDGQLTGNVLAQAVIDVLYPAP